MFIWRTREKQWQTIRHDASGDEMRLRVELVRDERGQPTGGVNLVIDDGPKNFVIPREPREKRD